MANNTETNPNLSTRKLIMVYRWNSCAVGYTGRRSEGWGEFRGYAVASYGAHHSVLESTVHQTIEAAALDLANPELVFRIVGYSCG